MPRPNSDLHASIQELTVEVAVLKSRLDSSAKALRVQAIEYERRLNELNHAYKRATEDRNQFVTRELHDQIYTDLSGKISTLKSEIDSNRGRSLGIAAIFAGLVAVAGLFMTAWHVFLGMGSK